MAEADKLAAKKMGVPLHSALAVRRDGPRKHAHIHAPDDGLRGI